MTKFLKLFVMIYKKMYFIKFILVKKKICNFLILLKKVFTIEEKKFKWHREKSILEERFKVKNF